MPRRISPRKQQQFRSKADRRANARYADDFALEVNRPRRQANAQYRQQAQSYRGAGDVMQSILTHSLQNKPKGLRGYDRRAYVDSLRERRPAVERGVRAGVTEARQERRATVQDIRATALDLRSARDQESQSIYQDLRAKQREKQSAAIDARKKKAGNRRERERDQGRDRAENVRKATRAVKESLHEIRSQIEGAALQNQNAKRPKGKQLAALPADVAREARKAEKRALREDPNRQKNLVRYLVTSQDKPPKVAQAAVAAFLKGPNRRLADKLSVGW